MALTARGITHQARLTISQNLELVKSEDEYCYWIYDDGRRYATHSVMVPRINDLRLSQWLDEARELVARVETPAC